MKKRLLACVLAAALALTLAGGILPTAALWDKTALHMGDVNGDVTADTTDARLTLQYAARRIGEDALDLTTADVNGDGAVDTTDARLILQYAAHRIADFPCGEQYTAVYSEAETTPNDNPETFAAYTSGNPIITNLFTADPSAHVWRDGCIYLYPSHDVFPANGCDRMDKYHVFSSDNMVDWADEGEIFSSADVMWSNCDGFMWAPDCCYIESADTYYYFFPHPLTDTNAGSDERLWNATWVMGVAKSVGSPTGPFEQIGYVKLADDLVEQVAPKMEGLTPNELGKSVGCFDSAAYAGLTARDGRTLGENGVSGYAVGGYSLIDPCAFVDDDGTVYLYYGGGSSCYVVELAEDMVTAVTAPKKLIGLTDFHEGSWVFKNTENGYYYAMYADNNSGHNQLRCAVSTSPIGPFNYAGVILAPTDCDTSHGSICQYKGNWYLFYHNCVMSGKGNLRSVCVDQLYFDEDGRIQLVQQTTTGVAAVGPAAPSATGGTNIPASAFTVSTDYDLTHATVGGGATLENTYIGNLHTNGSWCDFEGIDGGSGGKALVTVRYAAFSDSYSKVETPRKDVTGGEGYYLRLDSTNSWMSYKAVTCVVDLEAGRDNVIRLNGGTGGFNIQSITVSLLPENADAG